MGQKMFVRSKTKYWTYRHKHHFREATKHTQKQCEWHRTTWMAGPDCAVMCSVIKSHTHTHTLPPWEDQCEWHIMTRMTGPDCAVMCNLINTHTHRDKTVHASLDTAKPASEDGPRRDETLQLRWPLEQQRTSITALGCCGGSCRKRTTNIQNSRW